MASKHFFLRAFAVNITVNQGICVYVYLDEARIKAALFLFKE